MEGGVKGEAGEGSDGGERRGGRGGRGREGKEGEQWSNGGRGNNGGRGRDGGRGTKEAHSPGLVIAPIHPCVLAVVREGPSWFVGGRLGLRAVVLVHGCPSSFMAVRSC